MFKEDLTFLPSTSLPVFFPHASHFCPHSLPFPPLAQQTAVSIHSSLSRFVLFFFLPSFFTQDFRSAVAAAEAEGEEGEPVLEEQRLGEILGVLPQVYTLHSSILTELEERISQW